MPRIVRVLIRITYLLLIYQITQFESSHALEPSTAETDFHNESKSFDFHNMFSFYFPNYLLAFYHNKYPDYKMYDNRTPDNERLRANEVKVQFSFYIPLFRSTFGNENLRWYIAYTQLFFWQLYSPVPFIRETDYEPILWFRYHPAENLFLNFQVEHQSNGKGGYMEVSWNRVMTYFEFTAKNWYTQFWLWYPFVPMKADDHNPQSLTHFLGYDKILVSYNFKDIVLSVEAQNFESGLTRGHILASVSYSASTRWKIYAQYFTGYGQSLIEYDHYTSSYGIGIALSDWQ